MNVDIARRNLANYRTRMATKYGTRDFSKKWLVREKNIHARYCGALAQALRDENMGAEYIAPTPVVVVKTAPEIPDENRPKVVTLSRPEQWAEHETTHGKASNALRSTAVIRSRPGQSLSDHMALVEGEPRINTAAWFLWKSAQNA